jgi:hypothetical protein
MHLKVTLNFGCVGVQVAVSVEVTLTLRVRCLYFSVHCMACMHRCDEELEKQYSDLVLVIRPDSVSCVGEDIVVVIA